MTIQTTPAPTGAPKKLPPMVKAIREFVDAMEFPLHEHGPNPNIASASVALAMLTHGIQIENDATSATCSPSQQQVATTLHASKSYVEREMKRLQDLGLMRKKHRGDGLSCVYTLYLTPQKSESATVSEAAMSATVSDAGKRSGSATPPVSVRDSRFLGRQLGSSGSATPASESATVDAFRVLSGDSQGKNAQDCSGQATPVGAGSTVGSQESQESGRPESPSKTGLIVKREGSEVPPAETCICCKKLRKKMVGGIVIRRGPNGYCQSHSGPDFEIEA
jgi:hypothetical protein